MSDPAGSPDDRSGVHAPQDPQPLLLDVWSLALALGRSEEDVRGMAGKGEFSLVAVLKVGEFITVDSLEFPHGPVDDEDEA